MAFFAPELKWEGGERNRPQTRRLSTYRSPAQDKDHLPRWPALAISLGPSRRPSGSDPAHLGFLLFNPAVSRACVSTRGDATHGGCHHLVV